MSEVTINIHGGNNQILPNATQGIQNFYGDEYRPQPQTDAPPAAGNDCVTPAPEPTSAEQQARERLALYINKEEQLTAFLHTLQSCTTAAEAGRAVVEQGQKTPSLNDQVIVQQAFIETLLPFLNQVNKGKSISNLRTAINNALEKRQEALRRSKQLHQS